MAQAILSHRIMQAYKLVWQRALIIDNACIATCTTSCVGSENAPLSQQSVVALGGIIYSHNDTTIRIWVWDASNSPCKL